MRKIFDKKIIYGVIIGGILFGSIGVLATNYLYNSDQVSYTSAKTDKTNVKEALDELFEKSNSNNIYEFETIENPVDTTLSQQNTSHKNMTNLSLFEDRLSYNDSQYADYMCYIYPYDFTNISSMSLYQWNYISMHYSLALSLSNEPLLSRQNIIDNSFVTWTYSTGGSSSASNFTKKEIDVSGISGSKYICISIVSKNNVSDAYYVLIDKIIDFK